MQTAVVGVAKTGEDHRAPVHAAIAIDVFECYQIRRVGHVKFPVVPGEAHGKDQMLGKHLRVLESPVSVAVFEHADAATARLFLQFVVEIATGRFGDKKASTIVERGEHREADGGRAGGLLDAETARGLQVRAQVAGIGLGGPREE